LIDRVTSLLSAIADGTLAPGRRLTQDSIAEMLGVSWQPVSHAIQILKRRGLLVEAGKRGVSVAPIDGRRIVDLYIVREALDGIAAELGATRVRDGTAPAAAIAAARTALAAGQALKETAPFTPLIDADVEFHIAIHRLSGNSAIAETVAEQWPHFRRSMGLALAAAGVPARVWVEHGEILNAILEGDVLRAGRLARSHAARAAEETARRLEAVASVA
jgi:DNA-binding GntR family transcriptional regulator